MTPVQEIATLKIGSRPAVAQELRPHRGPARDSVGVQLGAGARDAAGLVRRGQALARFGDRGLLREMVRRLAILPDDARQHGDGAGEVRPADRAPLPAAGRGSDARAAACSTGCPRPGRKRTTACWRSPASRDCSRTIPALDASIRLRLPYIEPLNLLQVELLQAAIAPARPTRACRKASSCRSTRWRPRCATAASPRCPIMVPVLRDPGAQDRAQAALGGHAAGHGSCISNPVGNSTTAARCSQRP